LNLGDRHTGESQSLSQDDLGLADDSHGEREQPVTEA